MVCPFYRVVKWEHFVLFPIFNFSSQRKRLKWQPRFSWRSKMWKKDFGNQITTQWVSSCQVSIRRPPLDPLIVRSESLPKQGRRIKHNLHLTFNQHDHVWILEVHFLNLNSCRWKSVRFPVWWCMCAATEDGWWACLTKRKLKRYPTPLTRLGQSTRKASTMLLDITGE